MTARRKTLTYDLHNHVIPMTVVDAIRDGPERFATRIEEKDGRRYFDNHGRVAELVPEFCDADAKVRWMDRVGLDVAVISVGPPIFFYGLERVVKAHGFRGVEIATSIEGVSLADPRFRTVLKAIEKLGCFVFAHPYECLAHGGMDAYYLHNFVGFPLDTTLMIAHLKFSGALDDLARLRILCAHGGGFMPYQIGRFMHGYNARAEPKERTRTSPEAHFRRFFFDSLTHHPQATRHLIDIAGAERIVIGTDHPFDMGPADPLAAIDAIPGLTREEREHICELTALDLLGERRE